jgi:alkyl hydroperoxide reductase subunit D
MRHVDTLRDGLPEFARDLKLNLQSVLQAATLTAGQRWGVAITSAATVRDPILLHAMLEDARTEIDPTVIEDALAAAALMGMNNVFYRFRHLIGKESYEKKPARLRMNRIARPAASKVDFELFCLAASAISGCEACVRSHERAVLEGGLSEDAVHDAIRIAATVRGSAIARELGGLATTAP